MSIRFWMDMTILGMVFFFFQATLLLLMQGFAEKGDVEGTLWVHSSVRNMLELSTSAISSFIWKCLRFLRQRTIYTHIKAVMIIWIFKNVIYQCVSLWCEVIFLLFFCSKMLEYIKDSKMLLTEEVYSALVTAYGRTGYVIAIFIIIMWETHWPNNWWAGRETWWSWELRG